MKLKNPDFLKERNCAMCKGIFGTKDCILLNIKKILEAKG